MSTDSMEFFADFIEFKNIGGLFSPEVCHTTVKAHRTPSGSMKVGSVSRVRTSTWIANPFSSFFVTSATSIMRAISLFAISATMASCGVSAFAPSFGVRTTQSTSTTTVNLFGGGAAKGGENKGPSMMDQLAMFKKAQEMAQKKQKLDEELQTKRFEGKSENGGVTVTFKFVPVANPMDPLPDYEAVSVSFDDAYYSSATPEDLSSAVVEAIRDGIKNTNDAVLATYASLQSDLMEAFGGAKQS